MKDEKQTKTLRNLFKGLTVFFGVLTIIYGAASFTIYGDDEGVQWFMWRDQPWIAVALVVCSLFAGILWRITARILRKLEEK